MIQLTIAAGCAFSYWKVGGGMQPTEKELGIPRNWLAKFKRWLDASHPEHHEPHFTGRKELDARGRVIAAELQQAVGGRIHVLFHHWLEFDRKRWRTRWHEEDLYSGKCREYWMDDELTEDMAVKVVRIFPDYGGFYLWDLNGCGIGNEDPVFSDDLDKRFTAWAESWDACVNHNPYKIDKARLAAESFDERGIALARELKRAVGKKAKVVYQYTLRRGALEILGNGRTVRWPLNKDWRKWVLENFDDKTLQR